MAFRPEFVPPFDEGVELSADEQVEFAREVVAPAKAEQFEEKNFVPPYTLDRVRGDRMRVDTLKKKPDYRRETAGESALFEYALLAAIRDQGWFGEAVVRVRKTTEFDDVAHGVDFVLTIRGQGGELIHLAVDATTSADAVVLGDKIGRVLDGLRRKQLTSVSYFEDPDGTKGEVAMPRVILGIDREKALGLQRALLRNPAAVRRDQKQFDFLAEAVGQLAEWLAYLLEEHRVIDRAEYTDDPRQLLELVSRYAGRLARDSDLYRAVLLHAHALAAIIQVEEIKKSLGEMSPERTRAEFVGLLTDPLRRRRAA